MPRLTFARLMLIACLLACLGWTPAHAAEGDRVARIRAAGELRCGGVARPGLAFPAVDSTWYGIEVDICRAVAAAVLGPAGKIHFTGYFPLQGFDPVRRQAEDIAFLTAGEMFREHLQGAMLPGPAVFLVSHAVLVDRASPARHVVDLAGTTICAEPGSGADRSLTAWFVQHRKRYSFFPFNEADEMTDAFEAGHCPAVAAEATTLAALSLGFAAHGHPTRLLPEAVSVFPVLATTPLAGGDTGWSAIVAWAVHSLMALDKTGQTVPGGGPDPLPVPAAALGLEGDWQARMLSAVGSYGAIYRRDLGDQSVLKLPAGVNANWSEGGLLAPPYVD